jgi:hypothetical protein
MKPINNRIMKKLILILTLIAISHGIAFSQGCLPEGITFTTQEEIDNFQANYPGCTEIEGDVLIGSPEGNFTIMNLQGLNNVVKIDGRLDIAGCHGIGDLSGLNSLTEVGDYLQISYCTELDNLSGLNSLTQVGRGLVITNNHMLTSLQAFESLTEIGGEFWLGNNESLASLDGLNNLISIDSSIKINGNFNLADISALSAIDPTAIKTYIAFIGNFDLSDCAIQSICDYIENPTGLIMINNNGPGCSSMAEVEAACLTSVEEMNAPDEIIVFPNPATESITLTVPGGQTIDEVIIYNYLGQRTLVAKPVNNTVDIGRLAKGLFFVRAKSNGMVKGMCKFTTK